MISQASSEPNGSRESPSRRPIPIVALDVAGAPEALALMDRLPDAEWVKVGLQLFTAAGPGVVHALRERGRRIFLDLKLHDIPNTVAGAVHAAAALQVDLLTVHAAGGTAMLRAAAAAGGGEEGLRLLAVTLLTSLSQEETARVWGRRSLSMTDEVVRLAELATEAGMHGVVASAREVPQIRARCGSGLRVLTPGIRLSSDAPGTRCGSPLQGRRCERVRITWSSAAP